MKRVIFFFLVASSSAWGYDFEPGAVVHPQPVSRSRWLWAANGPITNGATAFFRKSFTLDSLPKSAMISVRYDDAGALYVNGRMTPPGDIRAGLHVGQNVFAFALTNGASAAGIIFLARLTDARGVTTWVHSDGATRATVTPPRDWASPSCDDVAWPAAQVQGDALANPWIRYADIPAQFATPDERATIAREEALAQQIPPTLAHETPMMARVIYAGNQPKIEVKGTQLDPLINLSEANSPWTANAVIREAREGVRLFQVKIHSRDYWRKNAPCDFAPLDARVRRILHLVPNGYLMLALDLDLNDWVKFHPEAQLKYVTGPADPNQNDDRLGRPLRTDPASPDFRAEAHRIIAAFGDFVRAQPWGNRVFGVRVNYGVYTEWHAYGMYEKPQTSPETMADLLIRFATAMKQALPGRLVGAYYGYVFCAHPPVASNVLLTRILDSPAIDFLSNPPCYNGLTRLAGGPYAPRTIPSAFRLRNKLAILEDDSRFDHVRAYADSNGVFATLTPDETEACMRRNLCNRLFNGEGIQLADPIRGIGTRPDVFDSPAVLRALHDMRRISTTLGTLPAESGNDTVVVVDPAERLTDWESRSDADTFRRRWSDALIHLYRAGAAFDVMLKEDFTRTNAKSRYRVVLDFNTLPAFRSADEARLFLAEKGSWLYTRAGVYFRRHGHLMMLHVPDKGRYTIRFPTGHVEGTELFSGVGISGEALTFASQGPATWLVALQSPSRMPGTPDVCARHLLDPVRIVTHAGKGAGYGPGCAGKGPEILAAPRLAQFPNGMMWEGSGYALTSNDTTEPYVVLDFGRELCGGLRVGIGSAAGEGVMMHVRFGESVAEALAPLGDRHAQNVHATRDFTVLASRCGSIDVGMTGFRFAYIGLASKGILPLEFVKAISTRRAMRRLGAFRCSNARLNRIFETSVETVHLCCQDNLWDGIKRDRCVWMGDMHPELMTILHVFGEAPVVRDSLEYMMRTTPPEEWMNGTIYAYTLWWMICMRDWWYYTGDVTLAAAHQTYYHAVCEKVAAYAEREGDFVFGKREFLDWPSQHNKVATHNGVKALMYRALLDGAELAEAIGETALATRMRKARARLTRFPADPNSAKSAAAIMAFSDFAPARKMVDEVIASGGAKDFSTFYGYYMLEAMAKANCTAAATRILCDYWGAMLDMGATSFWEHFDLSWTNNCFRIDEMPVAGKRDVHGDYGEFCYPGFRRSLCHGWSGGPAAWIIRHVLGLAPTKPGCREVAVRPCLGDLDWAEGAMALPNGESINVRIEKHDGKNVIVRLSAPPDIKVVPLTR